MKTSLLHAVRAQQTCDRSAVVTGIREFIVEQSLALRIIRGALECGSPRLLIDAIFIFVASRAASSVRMPAALASVLAVARQPNEWRVIRQVTSTLEETEYSTITVRHQMSPLASAHPQTGWRTLKRLLRIARRVLRHDGAFHAVRSLELGVFYCRFREAAGASAVRIALISTHSNPHGIALHAAARSVGLPVALITHGMPILPMARLDYDIALMECQDSVESYLRQGCSLHRILIKGRRDDWRGLPMLTAEIPITVGVFLSKDPVPAVIQQIIEELLRETWVREVILRPHPVNLWRGLKQQVRGIASKRVRLACGSGLKETLAECALVVASNSTIHIDALLAGAPSVYLPGGDHAPFDVQAFVSRGLVYAWPSGTNRLNLADVRNFYRRPQWIQSLRRFANIDEPEGEVVRAFGVALTQLTV